MSQDTSIGLSKYVATSLLPFILKMVKTNSGRCISVNGDRRPSVMLRVNSGRRLRVILSVYGAMWPSVMLFVSGDMRPSVMLSANGQRGPVLCSL